MDQGPKSPALRLGRAGKVAPSSSSPHFGRVSAQSSLLCLSSCHTLNVHKDFEDEAWVVRCALLIWFENNA